MIKGEIMIKKGYSRGYLLRVIVILLCDILVFNAAYFGAIWIRYDFRYRAIPYALSMHLLRWVPMFTLLTIGLFVAFKMYASIWAYVGMKDLLNIFCAAFISIILQWGFFTFVATKPFIPRGFFFIQFFILLTGLCFERFFYRFLKALERIWSHGISAVSKKRKCTRTMVIGAGEAGRSIVREIRYTDKLYAKVVAIIDDNPNKRGRSLDGVKIYGDRCMIPNLVRELAIDEIIFAIPSATALQRKQILSICKETGCTLKTLPGMYQLLNGEMTISKLRKVNIEDLLGREPVQVNLDEIVGYLRDKVVLVTGGGGTIGGELCRQIASHHPKKLIMLDIYENNAYDLQQELIRKHPDLNLEVLIASVRDIGRLRDIFRKEKPEIVYHAAAHKHVPLMEVSPREAVKNNVFGTLNTAKAAAEAGCKRFVLISTDKAVNPTNVMGATKRICEMIVQSMNRDSKTDFVAVRFGNVLGSSGSVVPLFKKQIEAGGPVTVTHPDIVRFFMTIPEAVSLVLQAGSYAKGGEIFILDMGAPVRIDDMARNLIRLSGYRPDEDIKIEYTGLRPGEKLYEEILMDEEGLRETDNKRIHIGKPIDMDEASFFHKLDHLYKEAYDENSDIRDCISEVVPTYQVSVDGMPIAYKEYKKGNRNEGK